MSGESGIQVAVRSAQPDVLLRALLGGELHFLVADAELAMQRDDLEVQALAPDPIAAALRPGHPLAMEREPNPADVSSYPFTGASTAPRFERWKDERGRLDVGQPFAPALLCDNYEVLVRLAERSDNIVFGPQRLLATYERAGRLKVMPWEIQGPEIQPRLIRSKHRALSPAAERLAELFGGSGPMPRRA